MINFITKHCKIFALGTVLFLAAYTLLFMFLVQEEIPDKVAFVVISLVMFGFSFGVFTFLIKFQFKNLIISPRAQHAIIIFFVVCCIIFAVRFLFLFLLSPTTNYYMIIFPICGILSAVFLSLKNYDRTGDENKS